MDPLAPQPTPPRPAASHPIQEAFLHLLLRGQGVEVERSDTQSIYRYQNAFFLADRDGRGVWGGYGDLAHLFAHHGTLLYAAPGGEILSWDGLVVSRDSEGSVAGPYADFDDWIWHEGTRVATEPFPRSPDQFPAGRYVHEWGGLYFVTVDPLPVSPEGFSSLDAALGHLHRFPLHQAISPRLG